MKIDQLLNSIIVNYRGRPSSMCTASIFPARAYKQVSPVNFCLQPVSGNFCSYCCWQRLRDSRFNQPNKSLSLTLEPICSSLSSISISIRGYAKGKDKKKSDSGKGKKMVQLNEEQLAEVVNVENLRTEFQKPIEKLKDEYFKNLSLRSTTGSIETLEISLDGKDYTLQELAQIVRKNPKTVVINMAVFPQAIPAALQALQKSGMNLNPQQDGTTLYIPIPKVTKEHRENLSKNAKVMFIKCRDSIKDVQNKSIKSIKSKEGISTDASHDAQHHITSLANQYIATAEKVLEVKQTELLNS